MVATVLEQNDAEIAELVRPVPLPDGTEPEERVVFGGLSWERYLAIDKVLGDDRPGPRLYYFEGELEIMTTSNEHERIKKWLGDFMADYFFEVGVYIMPRGQATMREELKKAGAEPDESWCLGEEKTYPDIVLEIALSSGGVNKLKVYRAFEIPEVWIWRRDRLEIYHLKGDRYEAVPKSTLLPSLDVSLLERCARIKDWREARVAFRKGLAKSL
jgi:Uma2 family endonuclease